MESAIKRYLEQRGFKKTLQAFNEDLAAPITAVSVDEQVEEELRALSLQESTGIEVGTEKVKYPFNCIRVFSNIHMSNCLAVAIIRPSQAESEKAFLVSSGADKFVNFTDLSTGKVEFACPCSNNEIIEGFHNGPVLDISVDPYFSDRILTCSMDGSVIYSRFNCATLQFEILQKFPNNHQKYCVYSRFSPSSSSAPDGRHYFVSASYDRTVCVYSRNVEDDDQKFSFKAKLSFDGQVESLCFDPSGKFAVVGVRDDNRLHYINLDDPFTPMKTLNMNENGDDVASFSPMYLTISSSSSSTSLAISTDQESGRILFVKGVGGSSSMKFSSIYGPANDAYSRPKQVWHPSGRYLFVTSDGDYSVWIYDAVDGKWVGKLGNNHCKDDLPLSQGGHDGIVRNLVYDPALDVLVTCSFDQTIRIWSHHTSQ